MVVKTKAVLVKKTPALKPEVVKGVKRKVVKSSTIKKTSRVVSSKTTTHLKLSADSSRRDKVSVKIVDNTKSKTDVAKRTDITPAVLSPFRFPVPTTKAISIVAYSFGLFFMALGTMFSAIHFPVDFSGSSISMVANTSEMYIAPSLSNQLNQSGTNSTGTYTSATSPTVPVLSLEETRPEPDISIVGVNGTLSGSASILVNVPRATGVVVLLSCKIESRDTYQLYEIGNAQKADLSLWKIYFDTTKYPNGECKIKVVIKNSYGTYDYVDQTPYAISNVQGEDVVTQNSGSDGVTTAEATTSSVVNDVNTTLGSVPTVLMRIAHQSPVRGTVPIEVTALEATSVKVSLKNIENGTLYSTGFFEKHDENTWRVNWDSSNVPDGRYVLTPRANISGIQIKGGEYTLITMNSAERSVTSTSTQSTETPEDLTPLTPEILMTLSKQNPVSNFVDVFVATAPEVSSVEIYALPQKSLTAHFLGLARNESGGTWRFVWTTTNSPNGEYYIYARVKTAYGFTEGGRKFVSVINDSVDDFTNEQEEQISTLQNADDALVTVVDRMQDDEADSASSTTSVSKNMAYIEPASDFVETFDIDTDVKNDIESSLDSFRKELEKKLVMLGQAERRNDTEALKQIREEIEALRNDAVSALPKSIEKKELIEEISQYLSQVVRNLSDVTIKNETILRERVGEVVMMDSDKDEISDYDEINLYKTNPFSADSDADGHNDNIEIVQGFNPLDAEAEAPVAYESPKEAGMVREDLLAIDSIHTVEQGTDTVEPKALISGRALPNSFVTLYIFSTPVVITVKTDAGGNWNYIFDKTLENGSHEMYVGITDNEGRIVAKSNPISFVKTAEAFAGETKTPTPQPIESVEPSLVNTDSLLTIGSVIVLMLGLALIFVGLHLRRDDDVLVPQTI